MTQSPEILRDEVKYGVRHVSVRPDPVVCCSQIDIEIKNDIIDKIRFTNGCSGNTQAVAALASGMNVSEVCSRLRGINCHGKGTSCPDQLAQVLLRLLED